MEAVVSEKTVDEVAQLKTTYQKNCRVMKTVGDFTYVISLQLPEQNVQLKFQLTASYPQVIPGIAVLSPDLSPDCLNQLNTFLIEKANQLIEKPMLQDLVNEGISWLGTNSVPKSPSFEKKNCKSSRSKKKSKAEKKNLDTEKDSGKKPSMRTAADVISRILWDESLLVEEFLVGYLDRFSGIQEKPFSAFSWEDVASVDYYTLAIPKHRICYFKYKAVKVWDKAERLDLVFGSTGNAMSLADVIENSKNKTNCQENYQNLQMLQSDTDNMSSFESFASSQNDTNFNFGNFQNTDTRANFFIALQINAEEIWQQVAKLQESISQEAPAYSDHSIQPSLLHVTFCALCLNSPSQIASAIQVLESSKEELSKLVKFACPLYISNVKHFLDRVLYADVETPPQFSQITDLLKSRFQPQGFLHIDHREAFQPHMTLFKLSQSVMHENDVKIINEQICERYSGYRFGKQNLDNLHLCSMDNIRQENGFYKCVASLQL